MVEREKARLLDAYFASHDRPSDTAPLEPKRTSKMTMRNGCLVKKGTVDERPMPQSTYLHIKKEPEDVKPDLASVKVQPVKAVQGDDVDQEEMPEIDYDDDTAVSAAIAQSRTSPTMTAAMAGSEDVKPSTAQLSIEGEEYEEEEGSYSDDEAPICTYSAETSTNQAEK
jgi:hypothetical protein